MRTIIFFILTLLPVFSFAITKSDHPVTRVIYITFDGVRRQEIFGHKEFMPIFWHDYAKSAVIYGAPDSNRIMEVAAKIPYSLPSYQSQMSGAVPNCLENSCSQIAIETFPERLIKKAGLKRSDVASIASWEVIDYAFQNKLGSAFSNSGTRAMHDPYTYEIDPTMKSLNLRQIKGYKGDDTRWDKYTMAQALYYYKKYKPKFLWISLNDADEYAHAGDIKHYQKTLRFYDRELDKLFKIIKSEKLQQETMIIITTDHGRGLGKAWMEHESDMPDAWRTWAFVINGELANGKKDGKYVRYSTLSIRPTVEKVFGIA
ncbi:MAG: hypothetical protein A3F14_04865 [Gammaproteobacteria bacterium RIFCSPHIGHO2_12_FULL_43_28]|nr:MAG: hypothetical protein A3F14_04865 [Gammaproteobacteria bacterium RIFCSPHIGHO2_12_FULL_43_28]